jgi:hypothetical protein
MVRLDSPYNTDQYEIKAMSKEADWQSDSIPLRLDPEAESADPSLPAFLARPADAPVYHGFPLLEESRTVDDWCFGTISDFDCPEGLDWGDAFVVAPDNSRAGIAWEVGAATLNVIMPPDTGRWGVYGLGFARPVHNSLELVEQLLGWLPDLRRLHGEWSAAPNSNPASGS